MSFTRPARDWILILEWIPVNFKGKGKDVKAAKTLYQFREYHMDRDEWTAKYTKALEQHRVAEENMKRLVVKPRSYLRDFLQPHEAKLGNLDPVIDRLMVEEADARTTNVKAVVTKLALTDSEEFKQKLMRMMKKEQEERDRVNSMVGAACHRVGMAKRELIYTENQYACEMFHSEKYEMAESKLWQEPTPIARFVWFCVMPMGFTPEELFGSARFNWQKDVYFAQDEVQSYLNALRGKKHPETEYLFAVQRKILLELQEATDKVRCGSICDLMYAAGWHNRPSIKVNEGEWIKLRTSMNVHDRDLGKSFQADIQKIVASTSEAKARETLIRQYLCASAVGLVCHAARV
jgi:hypothetical protein